MEVSIKFVVPSHPRYLSLVRAAVGELAAIHELRPEECRGVMLAVDEALANVIRHAYRGDFERRDRSELPALSPTGWSLPCWIRVKHRIRPGSRHIPWMT